ncbi:MAG: DUF4157 domain-containing protein [Gemmatimonadales bacterium]
MHEVLRTPGRPLDAVTRTYMESRFGHDFGRVRVHADDRAARSARAVDAHAYAVGEHLVFGQGRFNPGSPGGRRLLGHELTHVMQQHRAGAAGPLTIGSAESALEHEADAMAARVVSGEPASPGFSQVEVLPPRLLRQDSRTAPMVQRQSSENESQDQRRDEAEEGGAQAIDRDLPSPDEAPESPGLLQRWSVNGPAIARLNTIVCNGAGGIRVQLGSTGNADQTRCLSDCMRSHELSHAGDALGSDKDICKGKVSGSQINTAGGAERKATEIKASNAELGCLRPQVAKVGVVCKKIIEARIKQIEGYRDSFK